MDNKKLAKIILDQINQPLWDNWYIEDEIGTGSYSTVYRIKAERMNRTDISAVKIQPIIPDENTLNDKEKKHRSLEERRDLAVNEADIMFKLRGCPYIVEYQEESIRELFIDGKLEGYYFLIRMEYLDCVPDLIKAKKFDFSEKNIRKLALDIGSGIYEAHKLGIIHRDIKPGNFFIDKKGGFKLGDFNISQSTAESRAFAGTPGYLAPEIYKARSDVNAVYTARADIYSFGICLYQFMNDMYMPFEREMPRKKAIDRRLAGENFSPPSKASPEFAAIILKACAFNENDRYLSIEQLLGDLRDLDKDLLNAPANKETLWQEISDNASNTRRKNKIATAIAISAAVLLIAAVSAAGGFILGKNKKDSHTSASSSSMTVTTDKNSLDIHIYKDAASGTGESELQWRSYK